VETPTGRTIPQWVTLREAGLITGLPEQTLLGCVESGLVASDTVLSRRLGMKFVLLDSNDLVKSGLLRPSEVTEEKIAAILRSRDQVDVLDLESPSLTLRPGPAPSAPPAGFSPVPSPTAAPPVEPAPNGPPPAAHDLQGMALPEWVTLREASFITGLTEESLERQAESGLIESHSLGRRRGSGFVLLRSADLDRALRLHQGAVEEPLEAELAASPVDAPPYFEPPIEAGPAAEPSPRAEPARRRKAAAPVLVAQPGEVARMTSPALRWARRAAVWTALVVSGLTLTLVTLPLAFGHHSAAVRTDDMEPAYHVGDLVIARTVRPEEVRPNDVVTFRDPANPRRLIIQRVQSVDSAESSIRFTTKPDAGDRVIEWSVPPDGKVGVVARRFGSFGHVLTFVQSRVGQVALIVTPLLALGLMILARTWRRTGQVAEPLPRAS
jgi:signal peptidase I